MLSKMVESPFQSKRKGLADSLTRMSHGSVFTNVRFMGIFQSAYIRMSWRPTFVGRRGITASCRFQRKWEIHMAAGSRDESAMNRYGLRFPQFSIRAVLGLFVVVSLLIVAFQFAWPRRTVTVLLTVPTIDVQLYEPHLDSIVQGNTSIVKLRIDRRTNAIIVSAQARNIDAVVKDMEKLTVDPTPVFAASSLGVTLKEAQELIAGS